MANFTDILKNTAKGTVAVAALAGLPISALALSKDHSLQADAPQMPNLEQPQPLDPRVDALTERVETLEKSPKTVASNDGLAQKVKDLEDKQEEHGLDIDFNQGQAGRNAAMIIDLDKRTKDIKQHAFLIGTLRDQLDKLNKKTNKQKVDFINEKKDILALFDKVKQFAHYGDLSGFIDQMNTIVGRFNSIEQRLTKVENQARAAQDLAMTAIRKLSTESIHSG